MRKFFAPVLFLGAMFLLVLCGKKGPLQPPLVLIPKSVEDLRIYQRGGKIILEWKNPTAYIDGNPLKDIGEVEIWKLESFPGSGEKDKGIDIDKVNGDEIENLGQLVAKIRKEEFSNYLLNKGKSAGEFQFAFSLEEGDFKDKVFAFGLRVRDERKRKSNFSQLLSLKPQVPPLPPSDVCGTVFEDRIEIKWEEPEKDSASEGSVIIFGYNVYRQRDDELPLLLNSSLIKETKFEDREFLFGESYRYFVRSSATETLPFLESDDSQLIEVQAKDIFPPQPPQGLVAISGKDFISLSWEASPEKDFLGYRVWRKEEGQEFQLLTPEPVVENSYVDRGVESNRRYYYAITSLDKNHNESKMSGIVSEVIR